MRIWNPSPLGRALKALVFTACAAGVFDASALANPITVRPIRGNYCYAMGPQGWFVKGENPQRVAFGADLLNGDGTLSASYSVFGGGTLSGMRGYETPDRAVASWLSTRGLGNLRQLAPNVFLGEYGTNAYHGVAFYEVFPAGRGGFMIVLRTAAATRIWRQRAGEAAAVARSLHCNVPATKAAPDPPSLNGQGRRGGGNTREDDTYYNQWLDKEYYHNPKTGENVWVSPSTDYRQNGPEGPGYYGTYGNSTIKLDPGYR